MRRAEWLCNSAIWSQPEEPERHHHLSPLTSGAGPQSAQPAASQGMNHAFGNSAASSNYAPPPQEQVGTFKFDLSQLCNDQAGMAQQPFGCNGQVNHFGAAPYPYARAAFAR